MRPSVLAAGVLASAAVAAAPAALATTATAGPTAGSPAPVVFTVTGCESATMKVDAKPGKTYTFESNRIQNLSGIASQSTTNYALAPGRYVWRIRDEATRAFVGHGDFSIAPCPGRRIDPDVFPGDEDGDRRADLLAVGVDGRLRLYPSTGHGFGSGRVVGSGWSGVRWAARTTQGQAGTPPLVAVTKDGTVVGYGSHGSGGFFADPLPLAKGAANLDRPSVTVATDPFAVGTPLLRGLRSRAGTELFLHFSYPDLGAWVPTTLSPTDRVIPLTDVSGDGWGDEARISRDGVMTMVTTSWDQRVHTTRVGGGWNAMTLVTSPGDVTGDGLSDLVARRADGRLFLYAGRVTRDGAGFAPGREIGRGWNSTRLLL